MIGPRFFVPDDCVEDDEQLARRGDDRDELWLSGGDEFVAKRLEGWIVSRGDHGSHEKRGAHAGSAAADEAFAAPLTGLSRPGREADEGGDLAPIERSELRQLGEQRAGDGGSDSRHGGEQVFFLAPDRRAFDALVDVVVEAVEFALQSLQKGAATSIIALRAFSMSPN